MSAEQYAKLARRKGTLVEFFRKSPLADRELDLTRGRGRCRRID
jgi:hypothetical protein